MAELAVFLLFLEHLLIMLVVAGVVHTLMEREELEDLAAEEMELLILRVLMQLQTLEVAVAAEVEMGLEAQAAQA